MVISDEFCSNRRHTNGSMINTPGSRYTHLDVQHHLRAASGVFHANKWILCEEGVPILHQLCYLERVKSPVVCFCASHRAIHKGDLTNLDVEYRRLLRMVVGLTTILAYKSHSHAPIATKQTESQPYDPFHPTPLCPCA